MKSIIYILIAVFIGSILVSAFPETVSKQKQTIKLLCSDESPDSKLLDESGLIIKNRLEDYGLHSFDISVNTNQKTIEISFGKQENVSEILALAISKGRIEFYETYNRSEVVKLFENDSELFSLMNIPSEMEEIENSSAILGSCKGENKSQVDAFISQYYVSKQGKGIKFLWSKFSDNEGNFFLYLLNHQFSIDKSIGLESSVISNIQTDNHELMINFNKNNEIIWQNLTKRNIGKSIAIVFDDKVYSAPLVKTEINDGRCIIAGNFSLAEVNLLKSLINNDELPLQFKLME